MKTVTYKLPGMRKPREFVVYPKTETDNGTLKVQGEGCIGLICGMESGAGVFNSKNEYNLAGAVPFTFPMDFVKACIEAQPKSGDRIGAAGFIA